jgi:hypothetical protein
LAFCILWSPWLDLSVFPQSFIISAAIISALGRSPELFSYLLPATVGATAAIAKTRSQGVLFAFHATSSRHK